MKIPRVWIAGLLITFFASASWGQSAVEGALGGRISECRGAIAWEPEDDGGDVRVEALQLAALADSTGRSIAIYAAEKDFTPADVFPCEKGFCTATVITKTGVRSNIIHLKRGLDYGSGRVQYDLEAAFTIVSTSGGAMVAQSLTGRGGFICDSELGQSIAASTE